MNHIDTMKLGLDYEPAGGTQVSKVWWDGEKLMAKPIPLDQFYKEPAQQTIYCKHRRENNGVCPHHNLHCGWPKCNEPEQPAPVQREIQDWMKPDPKCDAACLYQCTKGFQFFPECAATPPAQRKPLTNEQIGQVARDAQIAFCLDKHQTYEHALTRAIEAAHGIGGEA